MYTDNSVVFGKACVVLSWNHRTSTPHRSETNGIAERAVRRVKEGTWTFWQMGKLLMKGDPVNHPKGAHFGAMVECHPSSPKDQMRIHQFGKKVLPS